VSLAASALGLTDGRSPEQRDRPGPSASDHHANFEAFISHASADADFAAELARQLAGDGAACLVDDSNLRYATLLRKPLQTAIADCRVLVLLWSEAASTSRGVMADLIAAFQLDRFIITYALDATPLPQFLGTAPCDEGDVERLRLDIQAAPNRANEVAPASTGSSPVAMRLIEGIAGAQYHVLSAMLTNRRTAERANVSVDLALASVKQLARTHPMVLTLAGYQCRTGYLLKHWDAIQAGRAPTDPLLEQGERYFFEALCINPSDANALSGLGSILFYEGERDAADFFQRHATNIIKRSCTDYEAAQHALSLILCFRHRHPQPEPQPVLS
jgi:TIR domain